jgi:hypothetical protein
MQKRSIRGEDEMEIMDHILRIEAKLDQILVTISDMRRDHTRLEVSREADLARITRLEADVERIKNDTTEMKAWLHKAMGWAVGAGILSAGAVNTVMTYLPGGA